jgi:uncharacterized membrane protein YpjA
LDLIWYAQIGPLKWSKGILVISFWTFQIHKIFNSRAYFENVTPIYFNTLWIFSNDIKNIKHEQGLVPQNFGTLPTSKVRIHLRVIRALLLHSPSTLPFHLGIVFGFFPCLGIFLGHFPCLVPTLFVNPIW